MEIDLKRSLVSMAFYTMVLILMKQISYTKKKYPRLPSAFYFRLYLSSEIALFWKYFLRNIYFVAQ